jgi:hypothetical protein
MLGRAGDGEEEDVQPLDRETITQAYEWLVQSVELPEYLVSFPQFAIRSYEYFKNPGLPEPLLVNSFFLKDLAKARRLVVEKEANRSLRLYLGIETPEQRRDLLQDSAALEGAIAPEHTPPARWPGPGRHPLVLLQQAAVNVALKELRESGIVAVNGPPGTGKTTLLRDIVAALVTSRAKSMLAFGNPSEAFAHSGEKLKAGSAWLHLYRLDSRLKDYEMIVASSNNKAVENVSAELPDLRAVAEDAHGLRYFKTVSDALLQRDTWGLVAAVLGNAANRARFKQTFWWHEDVGLATYLAEAAGTPQMGEFSNPETGLTETRPPLIVSREDPPRGHEQALRRWKHACAVFRAKLGESEKNLETLARIRELAASLPLLAQAERKAALELATACNTESRQHTQHEATCRRLAEAREKMATAEESLTQHDRRRPGFWVRLFRMREARDWQDERGVRSRAHGQAKEAVLSASQLVASSENDLQSATASRKAAELSQAAAALRYMEADLEVRETRERIGARFVDEAFFDRDHSDKHKDTPWLGMEEQRVRDEVFIAAMKLHKAFIDGAAKPLKHNLGVLMNTFGGRTLPTPEKQALMADLWSSLFLVIPLVSTTFASVERMLGDLPAAALGWLLVDEAGQALPQAAVGALLRTRRAIVVGDPMQIEPVVVLPDALTQTICRHFGVDPDRFNAPEASIQTLADSSTPYFTEFSGKHGSRTVGVPLLVHRRCAEPMFGISNAVAYERLMVNAKATGTSRIGDILGPSDWIHVEGSVAEKWCPEEGEMALALLRRLAGAEVVPDIYLITPFVIVAENLRKLVYHSSLLANWITEPGLWVSERIGTVHTVQGREAEAVLFVLGAPAASQAGARNWAGQKPNLLNVAVTRAKERLYVIGNRHLWRSAGLFRELDARLGQRAKS